MRGRPLLLLLLSLSLLLLSADARRRTGGRDFPTRGDDGRTIQPWSSGLQSTARQDFTSTVLSTTSTSTTTTTTEKATTTSAEEGTTKERKRIKIKVKKKKLKGAAVGVEKEEEADDEAIKLIDESSLDFGNLTAIDEGKGGGNKSVLVVDATYKAMQLGINASSLVQCGLWQAHWNVNGTAGGESNSTTSASSAAETTASEEEEEEAVERLQRERITDKAKLTALGIDPVEFLENWKALDLIYERVCELREQFAWARNAEQAGKFGIDEHSLICAPFKEELNPGLAKLAELAATLNGRIENAQSTARPRKKTKTGTYESSPDATTAAGIGPDEGLPSVEHGRIELPAAIYANETEAEPQQRNAMETTDTHREIEKPKEGTIADKVAQLLGLKEDEKKEKKFDYYEYEKPAKHAKESYEEDEEDFEDNDVKTVHHDKTTAEEYYEEITTRKAHVAKVNEHGKKIPDRDDADYYYVDENDNVMARYDVHHETDGEKKKRKRAKRETSGEESREQKTHETIADLSSSDKRANESALLDYPTLRIDADNLANPTLYITDDLSALALNLTFPDDTFDHHQGIALFLPGVCSGFTPKTVSGFDEGTFEKNENQGPIGINIKVLEKNGVNITRLAEQLRNDTEVDEILTRTNDTRRTLGGSFVLPVLIRMEYDPFSAPIFFEGSAVSVRFGLYIESMSNFQTSTMDYDMDIFLLMAWRDARLINPYDRPILVKEEEILEKIWRPDPFFANAKEAEFHEVTFLNFLMRIYPDGLVLYETRIRLKTACSLVLCKYPHDEQTCDLQIKSFAYPIETVRFEWFTKKIDAIDKNPTVKLPELYIHQYEPKTCKENERSRKSGTFACLRAVFHLKRDVGFHIAQTYIPTSLALMFSWVGVWLPEEFMEGRIGVAITVLLTLSTESAGAREHLPSVSYMKAIDLWFGFITGFVFFTLLQTLFVIAFDKRAAQLRKYAAKKRSDVNEETREAILRKADRYHKTGRYLDNFCRVFYPLSFALFLILYYFVYTEGNQDDCINRK